MGKPKHKANQKGTSEKREERISKQEYRRQRIKESVRNSSEDMKFTSMMNSIGLTIRHVKGDGNCMFRSIADQLCGNEEFHGKYRQEILNYISDRQDHFSLFIEDDETFDQYVQRMRTDGEWGDQPELYAAAQCLNMNIYVHQVDAPRLIILSESHSINREAHLSFHGGCHYNSVRLCSDSAAYGTPAEPIHLSTNSAFSDQSSSLTASGKHSSNTSLSAAHLRVSQSTPWTSVQDIETALVMADNDPDLAVEIIMSNPDGLPICGVDSVDNFNTVDYNSNTKGCNYYCNNFEIKEASCVSEARGKSESDLPITLDARGKSELSANLNENCEITSSDKKSKSLEPEADKSLSFKLAMEPTSTFHRSPPLTSAKSKLSARATTSEAKRAATLSKKASYCFCPKIPELIELVCL